MIGEEFQIASRGIVGITRKCVIALLGVLSLSIGGIHSLRRDDIQLAHKLFGVTELGIPVGHDLLVGGTEPVVDVIQFDHAVLEEQGCHLVQTLRRGWRGRVGGGKVPVLVTEDLADDISIGGVRFEKRNEELTLFRVRLKGLENDVQHAIRVQVEAADEGLDDLERLLQSRLGGVVLVELGDELGVTLAFFAEEVEATLLVAGE